MESKKNNDIKLLILFLVWCTIGLAFPFSVSQALFIPYSLIIPLFTGILLVFIFYFRKTVKIPKVLAAIFCLQVTVTFGWCIIHEDSAYINLAVQYLVTFILFCCFRIVGVVRFVRSFKVIMVAMSIGALFTFFLALIIKLPYAYSFTNPDGRPNYNFLISFSNTVYDIGSIRLVRPSGYFDEPGTLSFYLIVLLIVNDLMLKNKGVKYLIIACGSITLSVAFYFLILLYFLFNLSQRTAVALVRFIPIAIIVLVVGYYYIPEETARVIEKFTIDRIESVFSDEEEAGFNQGNNRAKLISTAVEAIKSSPLIGAGLSYASNPKSEFYGQFMGANIFGVFGVHGILGGLIFSLHIIYLFFLCVCNEPRLFDAPKKLMIVYFTMLLQRPDYIGGLLTYVSVLMLIVCVKYYYNSNSSRVKN